MVPPTESMDATLAVRFTSLCPIPVSRQPFAVGTMDVAPESDGP
jgi:hypothetical protein